MKFSVKDFFSKCDQIRSFLCSEYYRVNTNKYAMSALRFSKSGKPIMPSYELYSQVCSYHAIAEACSDMFKDTNKNSRLMFIRLRWLTQSCQKRHGINQQIFTCSKSTRETLKKCKTCSKLRRKIPERRH